MDANGTALAHEGHSRTRWLDTDWRSDVRNCLLQHCDMDTNEHPRIGTDTLRKTGYLFAVGGILRQDESLTERQGPAPSQGSSYLPSRLAMNAARHTTMYKTSKYIQNAFSWHATSRERFQKENFPALCPSLSIVIEKATHSSSLTASRNNCCGANKVVDENGF